MEYLLKTTLISSAIYLFYKLFLQKDTFFQSVRGYFIVGIILSFILPLLIIPIYIEVEPIVVPKMVKTSNFTALHNLGQEITPLVNAQSINWFLMLQYIYLIGIAILTLKFIMELGSLIRLIKISSKTKIGTYYFVETNAELSPFSFFNYIVYNKKYFSKKELLDIIEHEKVHVKQLHSFDNLLSQLFVIVQWFNPIVWLYKKDLQQNLEYIADKKAQEKAETHKKYQYLLLKTSIKNNPFALSNNFFNSQLKKRIIMLQKCQTKKFNQVKYALLIPLITLFLYSFNIKKVYVDKTKTSINFSNKTIVIDAGHGGKDFGAISNGISEKDIVLSISKKIKDIYKGNATIILIRNTDNFLSLDDKIDKVNKIKPDLLISLHVNSSSNKDSNGLITYISENNLEADKSEKAANSLMAKFLRTNLKCEFLSLSNLKILTKVKCPSVLVEAGYISNKNDRNYIDSDKGQSDIAQSIVSFINGTQTNNDESNFILPIHKANIISISGFGTRIHPITKEKKFHKGLDFRAYKDMDVYAAKNGVVLNTGFDNSKGYFIEMMHENNFRTTYYHLGNVQVEKNEKVTAGEIIGIVGSTGNSLHPHLHFEILRDNKNVNPENYLELPVAKKDYHSNSPSKQNAKKNKDSSKVIIDKKSATKSYSGINVMITKLTTDKQFANYIFLFKKENNIDLRIFNLKRNTKNEIIEISIEAKLNTVFSTYSYVQKEPIHQIFIGFDKTRDEVTIKNAVLGKSTNVEKNDTGWIYLNGTYYYVVKNNKVRFLNRFGKNVNLELSKKLLIKLNKSNEASYILNESQNFISYKGSQYFFIVKNDKPTFRNKFGETVSANLEKELLKKYNNLDEKTSKEKAVKKQKDRIERKKKLRKRVQEKKGETIGDINYKNR